MEVDDTIGGEVFYFRYRAYTNNIQYKKYLVTSMSAKHHITDYYNMFAY